MNSLLARQLERAARGRSDGQPDLDLLCRLISDHYDALQRERDAASRVMRDVTGRFRQLNEHLSEDGSDTRELLDALTEAVLVVDQAGFIKTCNGRARALLGAGQGTIAGRRLVEFVEPPRPSEAGCALTAWAAAPDRPGCEPETLVTRVGGETFVGAVTVRTAVIAGDTAFIVSVRDLRPRQRRHQAQRQNRQADADYRQLLTDLCGDMIESRGSPAVDCALQRLRRFAEARAARLYLFSTDTADRSDLAECVAQSADDTSQCREGTAGRLLLDSELPWFAAIIRRRQPLHIADPGQLPEGASRERRWLEQNGAEALVLLPLASAAKVDGFIMLETPIGQLFCDDEALDKLATAARLIHGIVQTGAADSNDLHFAQLLDATQDIVAISDRAGQLRYLNRSGRDRLAIGAGVAVNGRRLCELLSGPEQVCAEGLAKAVRDGNWQGTVKAPDAGSELVLTQTTTAHRGASGTVEFFSTIATDVSDRHEADKRLQDSEAQLQLALESARMCTWEWNIDTNILTWGPAARQLVALSGIGNAVELDDFLQRIDDADRARVTRLFSRACQSADDLFCSEHCIASGDGTSYRVEMRGRVQRGADGRPQRLVGTLADTTTRHEEATAIARDRERALITFKATGDGVIATDEHGLVTSLNPAAEQRLGVRALDVEGRLIDELITIESGSGTHPLMRCLREQHSIDDSGSVLVRGPGGESFAIQYSIAPIRGSAGDVDGAVMIFRDVSQERSLYQRLSYQARHDSLTGLDNRRELEDRIAERLRDAWQREQAGHALLYLDIDQFKVVNDCCGHVAGDELLRKVATLMREQIRAGDSLARIGGDEFCALLADCPLERAQSIAENMRVAVEALRFVWQQHTFVVSASIGLVQIDASSESVASLLSAADVACYAAKDAGRNQVNVYRPDSEPAQHQQMQWVSRITQACEDDRLTLFYHPIVPIRGAGGARHFELLLRMRDNYGKLIPPDNFIPAAERYNLMPDIDRWVVRRALSQLVQTGHGQLRYTLAINLSGVSLGDCRFLQFLEAQVLEHRPSPGAVCFEITETAAIGNLEPLVRFMHTMRELGCQFSLDDFGSGLSSFAYLKDLPVDYLKIDRVFVGRIADNLVDHSMVAAIHHVSKVMGIRTVAEGVEDARVLDKLKATGIDLAQGFLFGQPAEITGTEVFEPQSSAQIVPLAG